MIRVRGARKNNLRSVDVDFPLGELTVVTGVSGSGKSSLVFDTLHAEGRRRYLEALDSRMQGLQRVPVDGIEGLPPTVALRQHVRRPDGRDVLADTAEILPPLATAFARFGLQHDPEDGSAIRPTTHDEIIAQIFSWPEGTRMLVEAPLRPREGTSLRSLLDEVDRLGFSRVRIAGEVLRVDEVQGEVLDAEMRVVVDRLKVDASRRPRVAEALRTAAMAGKGEIVVVADGEPHAFVDRPFNPATGRSFPELEPSIFSNLGRFSCPECEGARHREGVPCAACDGTGIGPIPRAVQLFGRTWSEVLNGTLDELGEWLGGWPEQPGLELVATELRERIRALQRLRLGSLRVGARSAHLSAGEYQRLRLARLLAHPLSGVVYLLDEPSAGLGEAEAGLVIEEVKRLVSRGNTAIVVSHRRSMVAAASHLIELGPGAGTAGGAIIVEGSPDSIASTSPTGAWISGSLAWPTAPGVASERRTVTVSGHRGARVDVPLVVGGMSVVTGASGSGKTSVLRALSEQVREGSGVAGTDRVLWVDESRVGSARSMVATFVGLWSVMRDLLAQTTEAKIRGLGGAAFSLAQAGGRCEACRGMGEIKIDLGVLPGVMVGCHVCGGQRFMEDIRGILWKGMHAGQILNLTTDEASPILSGHPGLGRRLTALRDVGLGYLTLGQSTASLSGGEAARLRLAKELGRSKRGVDEALLLVDEPTAGLHPLDAIRVLELLQTLAEQGATVVVVSTDPRVVNAAAACVDLDHG